MEQRRHVKLDWISGIPVAGRSARIPARPGIYAYGIVQQCAGLASHVEWVYIGKAKNLRQRIAQHDCRFETNCDLQRWLRRPPSHAQLCFAEVPEELLLSTEAHLISTINPVFNRKHRTNTSSNPTKERTVAA